jgi:hypothetical protein
MLIPALAHLRSNQGDPTLGSDGGDQQDSTSWNTGGDAALRDFDPANVRLGTFVRSTPDQRSRHVRSAAIASELVPYKSVQTGGETRTGYGSKSPDHRAHRVPRHLGSPPIPPDLYGTMI